MIELDGLENEYAQQGKIISAGLVLSVDGDYVVIQSENKTGCAGCSASGGCGTSSLSSLFSPSVERTLRVKNRLDAKVGEQVLLSIVEQEILKHSLMAYGFPLILLILGAWLGLNFFNSDILSALTGFIFLFGGWLFTKKFYKPILPKLEKILGVKSV